MLLKVVNVVVVNVTSTHTIIIIHLFFVFVQFGFVHQMLTRTKVRMFGRDTRKMRVLSYKNRQCLYP